MKNKGQDMNLPIINWLDHCHLLLLRSHDASDRLSHPSTEKRHQRRDVIGRWGSYIYFTY